ncbi:FitA-like ribbon-helix-helix domain-containing protein [Nesterenkonia haasae]|uniref:FitA-like ribbon-helix-helix domain-containing protein n=1 Tax=Nesterenkonia haasae TaxID=2587813 RepID=UPI00192F099F|nr:toxin-antitoxin system [Nesterenkonia haasae]
MASLVVRGLEESVKKQLDAQAKDHDLSMAAEVRHILTQAARRPHVGLTLMYAAQETGGVEGLPVPRRIARLLDGERKSALTTALNVDLESYPQNQAILPFDDVAAEE